MLWFMWDIFAKNEQNYDKGKTLNGGQIQLLLANNSK